MSKGWTEERRRKQAERIRRVKPWKKSTGPKSAEGKRRSSMNAFKHGGRTQAMNEYAALLKLNADFVRQMLLLQRLEMRDLRKTNELKISPGKSLKISGLKTPPAKIPEGTEG